MAYKFRTDESVRDAFRRCAREQLDDAVTELSEGLSRDRVAAVHNARKAIKKERSLLRLARGTIPSSQRRRANDTLRAAGRALSEHRDADVMLTSIDQLSARFAGQVPMSSFDAIREHLESRRTDAQSAGSALGNDAVSELGSVRVNVEDWHLRKGGWAAIDDGLLRSYKRGHRALRRARASGQDVHLHAWRKRVKDLWYHERLLTPTCGLTVGGHAKELHRLGDLLGDDHDLAVLRRELADPGVPVPVDVDAVVALLDHRRDELQAEAFAIGDRLYAESPKAFRRRMRRSWKAGRGLARAPRRQHPAELAVATREPHAA